MKLKEIKNCMAICCTNIEQVRELDKKMKSGKCFEDFLSFPCYILTDGKKYYGCVKDKNFISSKNYNPVPQIVNFSDLIIPEMSAEDALLAYDQMCRENYCCNDCPIYGIVGHECALRMDEHITEIVDAIKKWKADREKKGPETEKKEPEIEWFWKSYVVGGSDYKEADTEQEAMEWCEYYAKEHPEAKCTYKHVCRVKAME